MPDLNISGLEKAKYVLFGEGQQNAANYVWQDREVRSDSPAAALDCSPGETVIDTRVSCCDRLQLAIQNQARHMLARRVVLRTQKGTKVSKPS